MEVVVIDNASFDGSTDAIGERFPDIKLIRNTQNRGFSAACNQGIRVSKGNIVLLLNSDAELYDQSLDVVVDYMIRNPEVGIAGGKMLDPNGEPQPSCHTFPTYKNLLFSKSSIFSGFGFFKKRYKRYRFIPENITDVDAMAGGFLFLSREVLSAVGLLDERFFFYVEDIDIARRVKSAGWRIVFIPKAGIIHLGGASTSRRPAKTYAWHHISLFKYFMKHHPLLLPINLLLGFGLASHYCIWRLFNLFRRAGN
jgi:GT2 family glycosyltransferase